jgi:hypothetical protein
VVRDLIAYVEK